VIPTLESLRDEAYRERLARRERDGWLGKIHDSIRKHRKNRPSRHDRTPEGLAAEVELVLADLVARCRPNCQKCGGEGWVWRGELDRPNIDPRDCCGDDTRYTCDRCQGVGCEIGEAACVQDDG
jgi:hypothetical protein